MYAVTVTFSVHPEHMPTFLSLMYANARQSLDEEPECHQFDVCTDPTAPNSVFLYEVYRDKTSFDAHLKTAHFLRFDAKVTDMIKEKRVVCYSEVIQ